MTFPALSGRAATIAAASRAPGVVRVICPPYLSLAAVRDVVTEEGIDVGAQDVHHELAGAYTGEISAPMLAGLATWVILGHSERRRDAFESDALINKKLARALDSGLRPIVCVGEQLADRDAGRAEDVVAEQVRGCLAGLDAGVLTIAIDTLNADRTGGEEFPIHDMFADAGGFIAENLSGTAVLDASREPLLMLLPLNIVGCDGAPVRAVALEPARG